MREYIRPVTVDELPAASFNASEWGVFRGCAHPLMEKLSPIVARNLVQGTHHVFEGVRHHSRRTTLASMKTVAEIIQRALAMRLLANDRIDFQPDQLSLGIVVKTSAPVFPLWRQDDAQGLHRSRRVFERTP